MFSLIITIVSIALVVALVAATMYHGGDTLTQGRTTATASAYLSGAQQIAGAFVMNQSLNAQDATSIADLINAKLLKSVPGLFTEYPMTSNIRNKGSDGAPFNFVVSPEGVPLEVCHALDKMAGRTSPDSYPGYNEYDNFQPYGCFQGEGLGFYFKM